MSLYVWDSTNKKVIITEHYWKDKCPPNSYLFDGNDSFIPWGLTDAFGTWQTCRYKDVPAEFKTTLLIMGVS